MGQLVIKPKNLLALDEVKAAIAFDQPKLLAWDDCHTIRVEGSFLVFEKDVVAAPEGPITAFDIRMELPVRYPLLEPKVFETGGRIPREADRHVNHDGDCCITVWEHWLATAPDRSISGYINGPLHEYFLGQFLFEKKGRWPFGERAHGTPGLEQAYAEVLGIATKRRQLLYHLRLLSQDWPKGHWQCPCGSGKRLRRCHREDLQAMHRRVSPMLAQQMLRRLGPTRPEISAMGV